MKILQLTKKFPFPLKDGESIAVTNLSESLNELGCEITLLSMNTVKHFINVADIPKSFNHYKEIHTVRLDNRVTITGAFLNLFSSESYHVNRFYFEAYKSKLIELLHHNKYDFIQLETLYLAPYIDCIRAHSNAKIIMRSHNVEFEIWDRIASNTTSYIKKRYIEYLTKKLKRFELDSLKKYDGLVTVTSRDLVAYQKLGFEGKGMALPIGINTKNYVPRAFEDHVVSISFIGSLDWIPNLEGLEWFINSTWKIILQNHPNIKLHIAGRNTPDSIQSLQNESIKVEGEVDDAKKFINEHPIMIVPLLSGSGMRVKILEGMALGRIVVSTSIGMEGIDATDKEEIIVADTPDEFAEKISWLLASRERMNTISNKARQFIVEHFDRTSNAQRFIHYLESEL